MVLFSGGEKIDDDNAVLRKVEFYMQSGANGVMFGRNMWLRPFDQAVALGLPFLCAAQRCRYGADRTQQESDCRPGRTRARANCD